MCREDGNNNGLHLKLTTIVLLVLCCVASIPPLLAFLMGAHNIIANPQVTEQYTAQHIFRAGGRSLAVKALASSQDPGSQ